MKPILITIAALVPDDISLDHLSSVAANAKVQVEEPCLPHPIDVFADLTFTTEAVSCALSVDGANHAV